MVLTSVYAALALHPIAGAISVVALLVPFASDKVARYWTLVKLVYGVTWLFICGWAFLYGHSSGLAGSIDASASLF
jgi:hypothetical protein